MTKPNPRTEPKAERIELRASDRQVAAIRQAAEETGRTVTAFVLDAAYGEAQRALADRRLFRLGSDDWNRFVKALDGRTKPAPRLRKTMRQRSVLE